MTIDSHSAAAAANEELSAIEQRIAQLRAEPADISDGVERATSLIDEIAKIPSQLDTGRQIEALREISRYLSVRGDAGNKVRAADVAVAKARDANDRTLLGVALGMQGTALMLAGQHSPGSEALAEALALTIETGTQLAVDGVVSNIAALFALGFEIHKAIAMWEALAERPPPTDSAAWGNRAFALGNLADARTQLALREESAPVKEALLNRALDEAMRSKQIIQEQEVPRHVKMQGWRFENNHARALFAMGRTAEAIRQARVVVEMARSVGSQEGLASGTVLVAACEMSLGKVQSGKARLETLLEQLRAEGWDFLVTALNDIYETAAVALDDVGESDKARQLLEELSRLGGRRRMMEILAGQELHLHRLGLPVASGMEVDRSDELTASLTRRAEERTAAAALATAGGDPEALRRWLEVSVEPLQREAIIAESADDPSGEHCFRVGRLSSLLAETVGLDARACTTIEVAARLRDIGKTTVPGPILFRRGPLRASEMQVMRLHASAGAEILHRCKLAGLTVAEQVARHHHERWDGEGYPDRLAGRAIPLVARIVTIADAFDAMTHRRSYREAMSVDTALAQIALLGEAQFDPELCRRFVPMLRQLQQQHRDLDAFLGQRAKDEAFARARRSLAQSVSIWQEKKSASAQVVH
ncbi:MAG: HD domain-containing protein [Burkholderiaceae bacterium]|nr:HD domain-containing protein [Burkholderiaceae bacterium]